MNNIVPLPDMPFNEIVVVLLGGALGSLAKDCLKDGMLYLPYIKEKSLYLGFVGGMIVGAFVGIVVDGSFGTALLAGYVGTSVISGLIPSSYPPDENNKKKNITS